MSTQQVALIYHYWNDGDSGVWADMKNPVLVSIATLRGLDRDIPVYVIDASDVPRNWDIFPEALNFKVIHQKPRMPLRNTPDLQLYRGPGGVGVANYKLLSRPFDIENIARKIREDVLVHVESDIFWLKPPLPLQPHPVEHFHFNFFNSGFWYYNKKSEVSQEFFQVWKHHILHAICNIDHRAKVIKDYPWVGHFQDEAVMHFCSRMYQVGASIPDDLNLIYKSNLKFEENFGHARNLHFVGENFPINRGLLGLLVDRFWTLIERAMHPKDLVQVFGLDYQRFAGKYKFDDLRDVNLAYFKRTGEGGRQEIREVKRLMA